MKPEEVLCCSRCLERILSCVIGWPLTCSSADVDITMAALAKRKLLGKLTQKGHYWCLVCDGLEYRKLTFCDIGHNRIQSLVSNLWHCGPHFRDHEILAE